MVQFIEKLKYNSKKGYLEQISLDGHYSLMPSLACHCLYFIVLKYFTQVSTVGCLVERWRTGSGGDGRVDGVAFLVVALDVEAVFDEIDLFLFFL